MWIFPIVQLILLPVSAQQSYLKNKESIFKRDTVRINHLNQIAVDFLQKDMDSVFYYASLAKSLSEKINFPFGKAQSYLHLSKYYNQKGDYAFAMANGLKALRIFDSLQLIIPLGNTYLQLAYIYKTMAGQDRTPAYINAGIVYSRMALSQFTMIEDTAGIANSLNMSGILYRDKYYAEKNLKYFDTAYQYYSEALKLINLSGKGTEYLGKIYNNFSQIFIEYKKDYPRALSILFKAVDYNKARDNQVSLLYNYGNISGIYAKLNKYDEAIKYGQKMLDGAKALGQPNREHDALYVLFQVYKEKGEFENALRYYVLADRITDSLTNIEKANQVTELKAQYEAEKKQSRIEQLSKEKSNITKRNWILTAGLGLFAILSAGLVILYNRIRKQKEKISAQSDRLTVMMKELHHRVKNNLQIVSSLLSLQSYKTDDEKTVSIFRESQQRVQAMSLIHQRLYNTGNIMTVDMKEYITDLAETLMTSFGFHRDNFNLLVEISKDKLDVDKALPIGLILNEIITNAMKYAYEEVQSPLLRISLKEDDLHLLLEIEDNGKGLDIDLWKKGNHSFGKQLIAALSTQLRAEQKLVVERGTLFSLVIPKGKVA